jgi:hypothetical protein
MQALCAEGQRLGAIPDNAPNRGDLQGIPSVTATTVTGNMRVYSVREIISLVLINSYSRQTPHAHMHRIMSLLVAAFCCVRLQISVHGETHAHSVLLL